MKNKFETAAQGWNKAWSDDQSRTKWLVPDPFVVKYLDVFKSKGFDTMLDIGCGVGRHSLLFAEHQYNVTALDESEAGLQFLSEAATARNLEIELVESGFSQLPFPDRSFDVALVFNVIYHGNLQSVKSALQEIRRILKPNGYVFGTMLSKRNSDFGLGEQVDHNTFLRTHGHDEGHPHVYLSASEFVEILEGFEVEYMEDQIHTKPNSWHWHFVAEAVD